LTNIIIINNKNKKKEKKIMKTLFAGNHLLAKSLLDDFFTDDFKFHNKSEFINKDNDYSLIFQVPGLGKEDISVKIEDNKLIIEGENDEDYAIKIRKVYSLPTGVKENKISAEVKNGILKIILPKEKSKAIEIKIE